MGIQINGNNDIISALDGSWTAEGASINTSGILTATTFKGNVTGTACTFVDGNFTGNVTVGGTLTYEDVTNIDSVGVVTARDHVKLVTNNKKITFGSGSNLEIYSTGTDGVVNAASGDIKIQKGGSGLLTFKSTGSHFLADVLIADSIIHDGDTNTKIRFPANDTIQFETAGGVRAQIGSGSDYILRVNNTNSTKRFSVKETTTSSGVYYNAHITGGSHLANYAIGIGFDPEGYAARTKIGIVAEGTGAGYSRGKLHFLLDSANDSGEATLAESRMTILDDGNVGIGIVNPTNKLEISGGLVRCLGSASARFTANNGSAEGFIGWNSGTFHIGEASATTQIAAAGANIISMVTNSGERLRITSGGQVNIGGDYTQTSRFVNINGGSTVGQLQLKGTEADIWLHSTGANGQWRILGSSGNTTHAFRIYDQTNSAERLRITSAGKVVIRSQGATASDGYAALEIRQNTGGKHLVLATNSATSSTNEVMLGFKLHPSGQDERVKAAIICRGTGTSDYGQPQFMSFCLDSVADNGNATVANDEKLRIKSNGDIVATGNIQSNNLPGNNLIHNGEFAIWQRGTTSIYSSQNKYLADRFKFVSNSEGNGSVHQHTNVPTVAQTGGSKFAYSLRLNCTTADTSFANNQYVNLSTRIEGRDLRHLGFGQAGTRYATLSFWQRSNSGTYHVSFRNNAYNRYYIASYTATNHTWEKHELTIPIDTSGTWTTDHSIGLDITWSLGGGSWYNQGTVGSWSGGSSHAGSSQKNFFDTVGNDFYITGVQFEKGTIATPFEHKSYGEDLRICQRYFFTITPPVGFINATEDLGMAFASSANEVQFPIKFPVEMRATPSVEQVTGSNYFRIGQGNLGGDKYISGSWIVNNMSPNCGNLYTDPDSNLSSYIGQAATIQLKSTSARLALRAEI